MKSNSTPIIISATLLATTALVGAYASSSLASADNDSVVDQINITVPISCTLSGNGMTSHNAEINNGLYEPNIGTTTLHAFCNDNEGFAIYAAGYTGNEIGGTNSNKLVGTSASNNATIDTGLATTAGNPDVSNWAMKLSLTQDSGDTTGTNAFMIDSAPNVALPSQAEQGATAASFSQYHVVPNEYVKVAHKNAATDMTTTTGGAKLTTTYAAYISKTQAADTYSGQVKYVLVHPASHMAPVPCNPNATTISQAKCMQDLANKTNGWQIMDTMVPDQQYTLKDKRDGKSYTVAKLQVGFENNTPIYNIWMTQNLDLDLDAGTTYTNEDTDIGFDSDTDEYTTASWTPARSTYTTTPTHISQWCNGGTINAQNGSCENNTPESYDPGDYYWNGAESDWTDWDTYFSSCNFDNTTLSCDQSLNPFSTYTSSTGIAQYHLGNYYNWNAAIAINDSSTLTINDSPSGAVADQSICPAGWTLPRIGTDEQSFYALRSQYGFINLSNSSINGYTTLWENPLYFVPSGMYNYYTLGALGANGYYWSSMYGTNTRAGYASFGVDGSIESTSVTNSSGAYSIRCMSRLFLIGK